MVVVKIKFPRSSGTIRIISNSSNLKQLKKDFEVHLDCIDASRFEPI